MAEWERIGNIGHLVLIETPELHAPSIYCQASSSASSWCTKNGIQVAPVATKQPQMFRPRWTSSDYSNLAPNRETCAAGSSTNWDLLFAV